MLTPNDHSYRACPQGTNNPTGGPPIPGFEDLTKIFESKQTIVLRGVRQADGVECVLKMPNLSTGSGNQSTKNPRPSPANGGGGKETTPSRHRLAIFAQQYELLKNLELRGIEGVIRAYDLLPLGDSLVLVTQYFHGPSLQSYMNSRMFARGFGVLELLKIGIKISHTLGQIHENTIIHRDITSSNILYNRTSQEVRIIDFGLASLFPTAGTLKKSTALQVCRITTWSIDVVAFCLLAHLLAPLLFSHSFTRARSIISARNRPGESAERWIIDRISTRWESCCTVRCQTRTSSRLFACVGFHRTDFFLSFSLPQSCAPVSCP